jgi:hypothetical protein
MRRRLLVITSVGAALLLIQAGSALAFGVTGSVTYKTQKISITQSGGNYVWSWSWPHFNGMTGTAYWTGNVQYLIEAGTKPASPTVATACGFVTSSNVPGAVGMTFQQFVETPSSGMSVTAEYPSLAYQQLFQTLTGGGFFPSGNSTTYPSFSLGGCTSPTVFANSLSFFVVKATGAWTITP